MDNLHLKFYTEYKYSDHTQKFWARYYIISNFFFGPFSSLGNCPYKLVRCLEPCFLELSLCRTISLVLSEFFRAVFHPLSWKFSFHSFECWKKTLIECLSFLISTEQQVDQAKAYRQMFTRKISGFESIRKWSNKEVDKNMVYLKPIFQLGLKTKTLYFATLEHSASKRKKLKNSAFERLDHVVFWWCFF